MDLVYTGVRPVTYPKTSNFRTVFEKQLVPSNKMLIATGYVSEDSLMELKAILEFYKDQSKTKGCDLVIGMHGREGFTRSQYEAACSLGTFLRDSKIGEVRVCTAFKFHGKVYSFLKSTKPIASIVGSSNLSNILGSVSQWEADVLVTERKQLKKLIELHNDLTDKATKPLLEFEDVKLISQSSLLEGRIGAEKVPDSELKNVQENKTGLEFKIPLKTELKSNLNAYFGKGRMSSTGAVRPRPWYEVEVIVPKVITSQKGYPKIKDPFTVYTDDGWKFRCKVSGQNSKNFRSEDDLQTLGRWIKGRLEEARVLRVGELIKNETLELYGVNELLLAATKDPNVWYLSFSPKEV